MVDWIKKIIIAPTFAEAGETRRANILNGVILTLIVGTSLFLCLNFLVTGQFRLVNGLLFFGLPLIAKLVMHRGQVRLSGLFLASAMWVGLAIVVYGSGTIGVTFAAFLLPIVIISVVVGGDYGLLMTGLTILLGGVLPYLQALSPLTMTFRPLALQESLLFYTFLMFYIAFILRATTNTLNEMLKLVHQNEQSLTESNRELQTIRASLEQRVEARTQRLETVASLGERLSSILDLDQLLNELVTQVREKFNYYHVHVYLLDDSRQYLIMRAGYGEAGAKMKAAGHNISLNAVTSLVARAGRTGEIVIVGDVHQALDWLPNPLLPDTLSEIAVPIILEGRVVGVLDVQDNEIGRFDESDAALLRSLANQVAVAIRNAQLFTKVETALAEAHSLQEQYIQQAWQKSRLHFKQTHYHYVSPATSLTPLDEEKMADIRQHGRTANQPFIISPEIDSDEAGQLVAPVVWRNQVIGAINFRFTDDQRSWTEQELAIIEAVINQMAQTAENMRLFDNARQLATSEQVIREITNKLRAAPDLSRLVEIATEELGRRLSATHAKIELGFEPSHTNH